jgi:hypothetical protein
LSPYKDQLLPQAWLHHQNPDTSWPKT